MNQLEKAFEVVFFDPSPYQVLCINTQALRSDCQTGNLYVAPFRRIRITTEILPLNQFLSRHPLQFDELLHSTITDHAWQYFLIYR